MRAARRSTGCREWKLRRTAAARRSGSASTVEAQGPRRPGEGVSRVLLPDGGSVPFDRLLGEEAEEILGPAHVARFGKAPGFLTKLLDSAIRLPVQAHPDRAAAKRLFGSEYGKTEAWIVIGRPEDRRRGAVSADGVQRVV